MNKKIERISGIVGGVGGGIVLTMSAVWLGSFGYALLKNEEPPRWTDWVLGMDMVGASVVLIGLGIFVVSEFMGFE